MVRMVEIVVADGDDKFIEYFTCTGSRYINSLHPHQNFVK